MASSKGTGAAALTKDNYVLPVGGFGYGSDESTLEAKGTQELADELSGEFAGAQLFPAQTTAIVHTVAVGSASIAEAQIVVLPEGVRFTWTLTANVVASGATDTTAALDADVSAAALQTALDGAGANIAAGDIVCTKVTGRRIYGLSWASAAADDQNQDPVVVAITFTPTAGNRVALADIPTADGARTA